MSRIFQSDIRNEIENKVLISLREVADSLMSRNTIDSTRAVGDAVQEHLEREFVNCLPAELVPAEQFESSFARRAMADFAFTDMDGNYYVVDSKTHNLDTAFNMPNLTSVERLARFYQDEKNYFTLLITSYRINDGALDFNQCTFVPIEMLDWSCLTIGALGWGQIQITNSDKIVTNKQITRKEWMLGLCEKLDEFYPKEIEKITKRITHFNNVREFWDTQP